MTNLPRLAAAAALLAVTVLGGCAASGSPAGSTATAPASSAQVLERNGLQGLTARQIIDKLDASEDDRANGPIGSVRSHELLISDQQGTESMPMPDDQFYLSIAPYLNQTHDCFNHNLATCRGELANKQIHVLLTDATGTTLLDQDVTTFANGFAGLWLPRDIEGTLTVTHDGRVATQAIRTGADDATCLTTLKLLQS